MRTENIAGWLKSVARFMEAMLLRMLGKHNEGKRGWNDPTWIEDEWEDGFDFLVEKARETEFQDKTLVDIANYCMIRWWYNQKDEDEVD